MLPVLEAVCRDHGLGEDHSDAICLHDAHRGTLSSTIIALHASGMQKSRYLFADGHPCKAPYQDLSGLLAGL